MIYLSLRIFSRTSFVVLASTALCCQVDAQATSAAPPAALTFNGRTGPVLVPMDSWVYVALDRLAALGYISDQASGLRPWTRRECSRQINEAQHMLSSSLEA